MRDMKSRIENVKDYLDTPKGLGIALALDTLFACNAHDEAEASLKELVLNESVRFLLGSAEFRDWLSAVQDMPAEKIGAYIRGIVWTK